MTDFVVWIPETIRLDGDDLVAEAAVPLLPASKIASGIFHPDRIPALPASKIAGQLLPEQLPPFEEGELDQALIEAVIAQHVGASDPHAQYAKESDLGTAAYHPESDFAVAALPAQVMADHLAAPDPHPQYLRSDEVQSAAYQPASAFATAAQGGRAETALQPTSPIDPAQLAGSQAYGRSLLAMADAASLRADLDVTRLSVGGRLSLASNNPVPTSNITAATTLYYSPYLTDRIPVRVNGQWVSRAFGELTLPLTTANHLANGVYDVFAEASGSSIVLSTVAWSSATARAGTLLRINGLLADAQERLYLGTIGITATAGQCEDSETNRFIWNAYNREQRPVRRTETTVNWSNSSATWRSWNGSTANRITVVSGLGVSPIDLTFMARFDTSSGNWGALGLAINSTTAPTSTIAFGHANPCINTPSTRLCRLLGIGRHYLQAMETTSGAAVTFYGSGSGGIEGLWTT